MRTRTKVVVALSSAVLSFVAASLALLGACTSAYRRTPAMLMSQSAVDSPALRWPPEREFNTESYSPIAENPFLAAAQNPLSTFSADVDTASYANVRRFIASGSLPPPDAVRIEELINYFPYDYPEPSTGPFAAAIEVAAAPWDPTHQLARIGIKGREIARGQRPPSNLVFLIDVSGSMEHPNKLPLLLSALRMLVEQLDERDRVSVAVYAGASGLALPPTSGDRKKEILAALDRLQAGGSTNGADGIELAYQVAAANFQPGGTNRVILATDGDFNVGVSSEGALVRLIEEKAKTGVFLTVLGFGMGNLKDSTLEKLADKGNGHYAYIDGMLEAKKVLVDGLGGTLVTIAKDVKLQLEFNPLRVAAWRLIGYENRVLRAEDFKDDRRDAGEVGAGHTVTALYELVPAGRSAPVAQVDALKYQRPGEPTSAAASEEIFTLKIRYKDPEASASRELLFPAPTLVQASSSRELRFAAGVAAFGMLLRDSPNRGAASFDLVLRLAEEGRGDDPRGYRREFLELARQAAQLKARTASR